MKPLFIQSNRLPDDWLQLIDKFDIDASSLPNSLKPVCHILKNNILTEKENSVMSYYNHSFLRHICLGIEWSLDKYEDIPFDLIREVFNEMGAEKGIQYNQKLSSLFSELLAYAYLNSIGYTIDSFSRTTGSCDLVLKKDDKIFHCEVKAKSSDDIYSQNIFFYINGRSYLPSYSSLRALDTVFHRMKKYPSCYSEMKDLNNELDSFCKTPTYYDGVFIEIASDRTQLSLDISRISHDIVYNSKINSLDKTETYQLLENILVGKNRHLTQLIVKSSEFDNFIGYLHLSVPFHKDISIDNIEKWLKSKKLNFDLFVDVNGIGMDGEVLDIRKNI
ncbi:MAG: hypothetical protein LGB78_02805 [Sulfurovum sp.]|nr:hypothetical protein [Sulfurovum sp.]MCB4762830.1 hypothetical protein [Sulfurovum sp.]MCB4776202.1 hypothetical protein [Sulfurovum sp.]